MGAREIKSPPAKRETKRGGAGESNGKLRVPVRVCGQIKRVGLVRSNPRTKILDGQKERRVNREYEVYGKFQ